MLDLKGMRVISFSLNRSLNFLKQVFKLALCRHILFYIIRCLMKRGEENPLQIKGNNNL